MLWFYLNQNKQSLNIQLCFSFLIRDNLIVKIEILNIDEIIFHQQAPFP